jgi:soluble lytic murein transglycosylase-like protein
MNQTVGKVLLYWPLIEEQAASFKIAPDVLAALACHESMGNPYAMRVEPNFKWIPDDYAKDRPGIMSVSTEFWGRKISWGLCQVMGQIARERGFKGWWPALCEPDLGLHYGAAHLAWCIARCKGDLRAGLRRYNGGGIKNYPDKVLEWAPLFKGG